MTRKLTPKQYRDRRRIQARKFVQSLKEEPCTDCGETYPYPVMQFDHVKGDKKANIGDLVHDRYSMDSIRKELAKCELVCANCHAMRTHNRYMLKMEDADGE